LQLKYKLDLNGSLTHKNHLNYAGTRYKAPVWKFLAEFYVA